jgi:hypothetical protein
MYNILSIGKASQHVCCDALLLLLIVIFVATSPLCIDRVLFLRDFLLIDCLLFVLFLWVVFTCVLICLLFFDGWVGSHP